VTGINLILMGIWSKDIFKNNSDTPY